MVHSRIKRLLIGTLTTAFALAVAFAGCGLPTSGEMPQVCSADVECDDHNPCTTDACSADGLCAQTAHDATVLPQVIGDCQHAECKYGRPTTVRDELDLPDDKNPCTADTCTDGVAGHSDQAAGAGCNVGANAGTCGPTKDGKIGCVIVCSA